MLDEIEFITPGLTGSLGKHWDQDFIPFWQTMRATHQETKGGLCFIVAGVNPASVERPHFEGFPNPIFQLTPPHYLEPFTSEAVRKMVYSIGRYAGMRFDEEVYGFLRDTYGGHPFLTRIACSETWKSIDKADPDRLSRIAIENFGNAKHEIESRLQQPIMDILLSLIWWYPEEYDVLQILASGDREFVHSYLAENPDSILQFARYGILKHDSSGEFAIADLRTFLKTSGDRYKKEVTLFRKGDLPPDVLPKVPNLGMLSRLFEKRCEVEVKLRRAIIMYLGMKYNWDDHKIASALSRVLPTRSERPNPEQLFIGRLPREAINDLYTWDLKHIILAHWDVFSTLFDHNKDRCEMNLETMNRARKADAHVHVITNAEASEFENSYCWLDARLSKLPSN